MQHTHIQVCVTMMGSLQHKGPGEKHQREEARVSHVNPRKVFFFFPTFNFTSHCCRFNYSVAKWQKINSPLLCCYLPYLCSRGGINALTIPLCGNCAASSSPRRFGGSVFLQWLLWKGRRAVSLHGCLMSPSLLSEIQFFFSSIIFSNLKVTGK